MANIFSFDKFKGKKKSEAVVKDIKKILHIINLSTEGLRYFAKYRVAQRLLSTLTTEKTLLEVELKRLGDGEKN